MTQLSKLSKAAASSPESELSTREEFPEGYKYIDNNLPNVLTLSHITDGVDCLTHLAKHVVPVGLGGAQLWVADIGLVLVSKDS